MTNDIDNAPLIDGLDPIRRIGSGGFAEVFLYHQHIPTRDVAVKVLASDAVAPRGFEDEANLMARVSAHPYIVTILEARLASDGRPYLVMEYYPGPNFQERAASEHFSVADVLRVGIQIGGALETAHSAGILHRDVKPANILVSAYGRPGLTDFGIAAAEGSADVDGLSIPWSPPEAIAGRPLTPSSDVYSLAATLFHLLSGNSPFHDPDGENGAVGFVGRITNDPVKPTGRADVPASLERLLGHAMAKDPAHRPSSAADFARALQAIEIEIQLAVTPLELPRAASSGRERLESDVNSTQVRAARAASAFETTGELPDEAPPHDVALPPAPPRRRRLLLVGLAVIALVAGGFAIRLAVANDDGVDDRADAGVPTAPFEVDLMSKSPMPGVTVETSWIISAGSVPSGRTAIRNATGERVAFAHIEIVPKELVATVDQLIASPAYDDVIESDPIVQYCLDLGPGVEVVLRWSGPSLDVTSDGADVEADVPAVDFEMMGSAWSDEYDRRQRSPSGPECASADPESTTSVSSVSTSSPDTSTPASSSTTALTTSTTSTIPTIPTTTTNAPVAGGGSTTGGSTSGGSTTGGGAPTPTNAPAPAQTNPPVTPAPPTAPPPTVPPATSPPATNPPAPPPPPPTDPPQSNNVTVPSVVGQNYNTGANAVNSAGLVASRQLTSDCGSFGSGVIVSVSPTGSQPRNTTITLFTCQ